MHHCSLYMKCIIYLSCTAFHTWLCVLFQLHCSELDTGTGPNVQSITEQTDLDDFLATAELAGTEFAAGTVLSNVGVSNQSKLNQNPVKLSWTIAVPLCLAVELWVQFQLRKFKQNLKQSNTIKPNPIRLCSDCISWVR